MFTLGVLIVMTYGAWARYLGEAGLPLIFFLLLLQVAPPSLVVRYPLNALRPAAVGMVAGIIAVVLAAGVGVVQMPRTGTKTLVWSLLVVAVTLVAGYGMQQRRRALAQADEAERTTVEERAKRTTLQERALIALRTDSARSGTRCSPPPPPNGSSRTSWPVRRIWCFRHRR